MCSWNLYGYESAAAHHEPPPSPPSRAPRHALRIFYKLDDLPIDTAESGHTKWEHQRIQCRVKFNPSRLSISYIWISMVSKWKILWSRFFSTYSPFNPWDQENCRQGQFTSTIQSLPPKLPVSVVESARQRSAPGRELLRWSGRVWSLWWSDIINSIFQDIHILTYHF